MTTPSTPLSRALAFPAAAFLAFAAGQLWAGAETSSHILETMGLKLPVLTRVVYGSPLIVTSGLLLGACLVLAGSHWRVPASWSSRAAQACKISGQTGVGLGLWLAALVLAAYPICFTETQIALQK